VVNALRCQGSVVFSVIYDHCYILSSSIKVVSPVGVAEAEGLATGWHNTQCQSELSQMVGRI